MTALLERPDTAVPSKEETQLATESSRLLSKLSPDGTLKVRLDDGQELILPKSATRLLEKGEMEFHMVGTHRRVKFQTIQDYKEKMEERSKNARDQLAKQAQELN